MPLNNQRVLLSLLLAYTTLPAFADLTFTGFAYDMDGGQLLYTEHHQRLSVQSDQPILKTVFKDASGEVIAEREVVCDAEMMVQSFDMQDRRTGYREQVMRTGQSMTLIKTPVKQNSETEVISGSSINEVIIDAGFNSYVTRHWEALLSGKTMRFEFASVDRLDLLKLQVKHVGSSNENGFAIERFEMNAANFVIRLLLDPIQVDYYADSRELFRYQGISNMKDVEGGNYSVRIEFPRDAYVSLDPDQNTGTGELTSQ